MSIEQGQPSFHHSIAANPPAAEAAKQEKPVSTHGQLDYGQPEVAMIAPAIIRNTPHESQNKMESQDGATPIQSARKTNEAAKPVLQPRPPLGPSPRRFAVTQAQPQLSLSVEPIGGGGARLLEPINPRQKQPVAKADRGLTKQQEREAFKKRLEDKPLSERPSPISESLSPSSVLRQGSPQNLTSAYTRFQESKAKELEEANKEKAEGGEERKRAALQEMADEIFPVIDACIKQQKSPILEGGKLKVSDDPKGKGVADEAAFNKIADVLTEAYSKSLTRVWVTNGVPFTTLCDSLHERSGMPIEILKRAKATFEKPIQQLKAEEAAKQSNADTKPPVTRQELFEQILAGNPEAVDVMLFSHREDPVIGKPFATLLNKLHQLDRSDLPDVSKAEAYANALAFVSLYLEMGVSIPTDPAKKIALRDEMQALVQHAASHPNPAISSYVKPRAQEAQQAIAVHLQPPSEGDVLFAIKRARQNKDLEGALSALDLSRGRSEPAITRAREELQNELRDNDRIQYSFNERSAKEIAADLGACIENIFRSMRPSELELRAFSKDSAKAKDAPALNDSGDLFNRISDYLKEQIVSARSRQDLAKALAKLVDIGYEAMQNGNYELAISVESALSDGNIKPLIRLMLEETNNSKDNRAVGRLYGEDSRRKRAELEQFTDAGGDYANYQRRLAADRAAGKTGIPFLVPIKRAAISLGEVSSSDGGMINVNQLSVKANLKRKFAKVLAGIKERPLPRGNPAASVVLMRVNLTERDLEVHSKRLQRALKPPRRVTFEE